MCENYAARLKHYMQLHPGTAMLAVASLGIAATFTVRALAPAPSKNRAVQLLEDIPQHLLELADGSAQTVGRGVDRINDLNLNRKLGRLSHGIKNMFH